MRRKLLTLCAAMSLLLLAAVSALWLRSHFAFDAIHYGWRASQGNVALGWDEDVRYVQAWSSCGRLFVEYTSRPLTSVGDLGFLGLLRSADPPKPIDPSYAGPRGFRFAWSDSTITSERIVRVAAPYWLFAAPAAVVSATAVALARRCRRRSRRVDGGACPSCHYDLRATPDRCPECGTVTGVETSWHGVVG